MLAVGLQSGPIAVTALVIGTLFVFHGGLQETSIGATAFDDKIVRWFNELSWPGLHTTARVIAAGSSWWTVNVGLWVLVLALLALRRWRQAFPY